jgi:hypothetical protein
MEVGRILQGAKWQYRLVNPLTHGVHISRVFKAEMLPGRERRIPAKWSSTSLQLGSKFRC